MNSDRSTINKKWTAISLLRQICLFFFDIRGVQRFFELNQELNAFEQNNEMNHLVGEYKKKYLRTCWDIYYATSIILFLLMHGWAHFVSPDEPQYHAKLYTPLCLLVLTAVINYGVNRNPRYLTLAFILLDISFGINLIIENWLLQEFKIIEMWLVYHSRSLMFMIPLFTEWKFSSLLFSVIQVLWAVVMYSTFDNVEPYFFGVILFVIIIHISFNMFIVKLIYVGIVAVYENMNLVDTMKSTMQALPDSILINGVQRKSQLHPNLVFSNDSALIEDFVKLNKSSEDVRQFPSLENIFRWNEHSQLNDDFNKWTLTRYHEDDSKTELILTLMEVLSYHENWVDREKTQISSQIEILNENNDENSNPKVFTIKSIEVKWEKCHFAYLHVLSDISSFKELEKEKVTNQCMHIMFSSLSHEFRTPLNSFANSLLLIRSAIDQMKCLTNKDEVPHIPKLDTLHIQVDKFLKIGLVSSKILELLVEDIMDFAKIEAGTFSLNTSYFKIGELTTKVEDIFMHQCLQKRVEFAIEWNADVANTWFNSDCGRILQVLMNLISNSVKFTNQGQILVSIILEEKKSLNESSKEFEDDRFMRITVSDTGVGIWKEDKEHLFKMFGIIKKHKDTMNMKGTGLGLTISK